MAVNTVNGSLICTDGFVIPLQAELTEGTEGNLTTATAQTVTAQPAGTYGVGKVVQAGLVTTDNGAGYAYILSEGLVAAIIPMAVKGVSCHLPQLCKPYMLKAGDQVRVMNSTAASRLSAFSVFTNQGVERIFTATPSGAGTNTYVDLQTGNGLGDTLQGQSIMKAMSLSVDGAKIESAGVSVFDASGNIVGIVPFTNPIKYYATMQPAPQPIPVALNFSASFVTNA
jgi:hypothetical protein